MYKISKETNLAYLFFMAVYVAGALFGNMSWWGLIVMPISYGIMYFYISIFIWDKRRQFTITLSQNAFRKGDLISIGRSEQTGLVLKINAGVNNQITATVFPLKVTKYKLVNIVRLWYIKVSYWLRNVGR